MSFRKSRSTLYLLVTASSGGSSGWLLLLEQLFAGTVRMTFPCLEAIEVDGSSDMLDAMLWSMYGMAQLRIWPKSKFLARS